MLKSLHSIEEIQPKMMCAIFNGELCATIVSGYIPSNARDEADSTILYK